MYYCYYWKGLLLTFNQLLVKIITVDICQIAKGSKKCFFLLKLNFLLNV